MEGLGEIKVINKVTASNELILTFKFNIAVNTKYSKVIFILNTTVYSYSFCLRLNDKQQLQESLVPFHCKMNSIKMSLYLLLCVSCGQCPKEGIACCIPKLPLQYSSILRDYTGVGGGM